MVTVVVKNGNVERAMRTLKKKLQKEGVLKDIKSRQYFEKPSAKRARKKAEGIISERGFRFIRFVYAPRC